MRLNIKRPVLYVLGFLISGILIGRYYSGESTLFHVLVLLCGLFACAILHKFSKYVPVFIFVLFLIIGLWRMETSLFNHTLPQPEGTEFVFSGIVLDTGYTGTGNRRAVVRGTINGGDVRIMVYMDVFQVPLVIGQEVTLTGELLPLSFPTNPGGYNQFQHLRSQKIDAVMRPTAVVPGEVQTTITNLMRRSRDRLAEVYDRLLPINEAGVIRSMVLGDRRDMDMDLADLYRVMGIFHILSISGLHVAVLMMAVNKLLGLFMQERRAAVLALILMVFYCLLTGAAVATVRAVLMGGVLVFGKIIHRDYDLLATVSWAAVALLIYEPLYLFNVGFQLSFGAVYGIGLLSKPIERAILMVKILPSPKAANFRSGLSVGIAAVASTNIVFAYHFNEIPLYSIVGNLVIMPTTTLILVLGITVGLLGLVFIPLASVLAGVIYYILRFYELSARFFASLPYAMILVGGRNLALAGLGVLSLVAFCYAFSYGETFRRRFALFIVSLILLAGGYVIRAFPPTLHITQLETNGNYTVLRHMGDTIIIGAAQGGENEVLRYLDLRGVHSAALILTEPPRAFDVDRLELLFSRVHTLYLPGHVEGVTRSLMHSALAQTNLPPVYYLNAGDIRRTHNLDLRFHAYDGGRIGVDIYFRNRWVENFSMQ